MNFTRIIKDNLGKLFEDCGFEITEESNSSIEFQHNQLKLIFYYNSYERSFGYYIYDNTIDLGTQNFVLEDFLKIRLQSVYGLKTQEEKIKYWIDWVLQYLKKLETSFLAGDQLFLKKFKEYVDMENKKYNKKFQQL